MISLEVESARMADHDIPRLVRGVRTNLAERRLQFVDEKINGMARAFRAQRPEAPEKRLAGERRLGAERERSRHVGAAADTGIEQHCGAAADGLHHPWHTVD